MRDQQAGSGFLAEVETSLATDSRISGYWLEEQIGQAGWPSCSGPVTSGCTGWWR